MAEPSNNRPPSLLRSPLVTGAVVLLAVAALLGLAAAVTTVPAAEPVASAAAGPTAMPGTTAVVAAPLESSAIAGVVTVRGTPVVVPEAAVADTPATGPDWWNLEQPVDPSLAQQIEQAYNRFWAIRTQALLADDADSIAQVMDGQQLSGERQVIDQLRSQNQAEKVDVQHNARVLHASEDEAAVLDQYINRTVLLDLTTGQALDSAPNELWQMAYELRKVDGAWKVIQAVNVANAQ